MKNIFVLIVFLVLFVFNGNAFAYVTQVPEPTSLILLGLGIAGLVGMGRKFKK
ncbi:MAG: hypothetical protein C0408_09470 [Odoribacter sp.]|nr:hypothetical protein [Odoribacter sp.]